MEITKQKAQSLRMKMQNAKLYLKGATDIYGLQRAVKGIFVTRDGPFFFPVKSEMANVFLVNRNFQSRREP